MYNMVELQYHISYSLLNFLDGRAVTGEGSGCPEVERLMVSERLAVSLPRFTLVWLLFLPRVALRYEIQT